MAPLKVPDTGLLLESHDVPNAKVPIQAFAITLDRSAIEEMIKCVQDGGSISLGLGKTPVSTPPIMALGTVVAGFINKYAFESLDPQVWRNVIQDSAEQYRLLERSVSHTAV